MFGVKHLENVYEEGWIPSSPMSRILDKDIDLFLDLYKWMLMSREIDRVERELVARGEGFFHVSSAGHEMMAVLNEWLTPEDIIFSHYRDRALWLARGVSPTDLFHAFYATDYSGSRGRQMSPHICDVEHNIASIVGPVGNQGLQAVGAAIEHQARGKSIISLCAMGDGTSQQGEIMESIAEAVRVNAPVLFLIEDNGYSISTETSTKTFYSTPTGEPASYYGLPIHRFNGCDIANLYTGIGQIIDNVREQCQPALVVMSTSRLSDHTNADDQSTYRSEISVSTSLEKFDPLVWMAAALKNAGVPKEKLLELSDVVKEKVSIAEGTAKMAPPPSPSFDVLAPLPDAKEDSVEIRECKSNADQATMRDAIARVLRHHLESNNKVCLLGEDIEDPKGDVFGVTKGLSTDFPNRVVNSALTESTIVGISIGRALVGGRPVAFIQFADFLGLAFNQIASELATMYWRTDGSWNCPVIIMVPCGGYRPGLGPFHAQTLDSLVSMLPGIDVMVPSNASDAAGLLNAAFHSTRPVAYLYPKALLNDLSVSTSYAELMHAYIPPGAARVIQSGSDLTIVSWGNCIPICQYAVDMLSECEKSFECTLIDLRSLSPWDQNCVIDSVKISEKLLIVHEDNKSGGMGAEIIATVQEFFSRETNAINLKTARVARNDTHVPFHFGNQIEVLPSRRRTLEAACVLLDCDIEWMDSFAQSEPGIIEIAAGGSSPSDESVVVLEWLVSPNDQVKKGDMVALLEADKAVYEFLSAYDGKVHKLHVAVSEIVKVGDPLFSIKLGNNASTRKIPQAREKLQVPIITASGHSISKDRDLELKAKYDLSQTDIYLRGIASLAGDSMISNEMLADRWKDKSAQDITDLTGIDSRRHIGPTQSLVSMAVKVARQVLENSGVALCDIKLIVCSSTTPDISTPSLSCRVFEALGGENSNNSTDGCACVDISAACTGYLYGLGYVHDFLQQEKQGHALLVTSEILSPLLNHNDYATSIVFGDAATATLIEATDQKENSGLVLSRPFLSATSDGMDTISVPHSGISNTYINIQGSKVYPRGIKRMMEAINSVCKQTGIPLEKLDLLVPHQANQRMLNTLATKMGIQENRVLSNIHALGNTSSSSIPACMADNWGRLEGVKKIGLVAFGGGLTYGAAIIKNSN